MARWSNRDELAFARRQTMAQEEKSEEPPWLADLRESTTEQRLYTLGAIPTEELTVYYLRLMSHILDLVGGVNHVNQNTGGRNERTSEQFRDDIIAALERRLEMERLTAQLEEANLQDLAVRNIYYPEQVALGNWVGEAWRWTDVADEKDEDTMDQGGIYYLRRIVRFMDLRMVNDNVGEWDPRTNRVVTLMDVKEDIRQELLDRMPSEPGGTPFYYNSDNELTNRTPRTDSEDSDDESEAESDESETHSQVERREQRELEEELWGPDPNGLFDDCDGRAYDRNESAGEEES